MRKICTFKVNETSFGIDVLKVLGVLFQTDVVRVPHANKSIQGVILHRGQILTVVDLRKKFEMPDRAPDQKPLHTIVKTKRGLVSFLVDEVGEIQDIQQNTRMEISKQVMGIDSFFVSHSYKINGVLLSIIDAEKIIDMKSELSM
ncbi:MAG: chemotaxis protein CheW [Leptospiraceae bacterium]|nr:chemotaxis protein CheW [Leptospiraceae bacterium]MCP5510348.1 chemotaxis protein CheW [Leptospiraceae bacterium]